MDDGVSLDFCFWDEIDAPIEAGTTIGDADASSSPAQGRPPSDLVNIFGSRGEIKGSACAFPSAFLDFDEEKKPVGKWRGGLRMVPSGGVGVAMVGWLYRPWLGSKLGQIMQFKVNTGRINVFRYFASMGREL